MNQTHCSGCGAPAQIPDPTRSVFCSFCGNQVHQPALPPHDPEMAKQQQAAAKQQDLEARLAQQKKIIDRSEMWIIAISLSLLLPSILGAAISCPLLATNGYGTLAIIIGLCCFPIAVLGITLVVFQSKKQDRAKESIKELERQLGKDVRSLGEKIIDKVFGRES